MISENIILEQIIKSKIPVLVRNSAPSCNSIKQSLIPSLKKAGALYRATHYFGESSVI